jgi:hypothetical protein
MDQIKTVRNYAIEALDCFDKMAKPEIQNRVMGSIWNYIFKYILKTINKKPEKELKEKLLEIYLVLNPLFSEPIPDVGEMKSAKELLNVDSERAAKILKELLEQ